MSEVIITETKTETITHEVKTVKALKCDVCGQEFTGDYWRLFTFHNDWGNDSVDSNEFYDLCSEECVRNALEEYLEKCKHSNTQEFELSQKYFKEHRET